MVELNALSTATVRPPLDDEGRGLLARLRGVLYEDLDEFEERVVVALMTGLSPSVALAPEEAVDIRHAVRGALTGFLINLEEPPEVIGQRQLPELREIALNLARNHVSPMQQHASLALAIEVFFSYLTEQTARLSASPAATATVMGWLGLHLLRYRETLSTSVMAGVDAHAFERPGSGPADFVRALLDGGTVLDEETLFSIASAKGVGLVVPVAVVLIVPKDPADVDGRGVELALAAFGRLSGSVVVGPRRAPALHGVALVSLHDRREGEVSTAARDALRPAEVLVFAACAANTLSALPDAYRRALNDVGLIRMPPRHGAITSDDLWLARIAARLDRDLLAETVRRSLGGILALPANRARKLLWVLAAWYRHRMNAEAVAAELGGHAQTVRLQLRQIAERTRLSPRLDAGQLEFAVRLWHECEGALPAPGDAFWRCPPAVSPVIGIITTDYASPSD